MGNKVQAKKAMKKIGIPVIFGSDDLITNVSEQNNRQKKQVFL